MKKVLFITLLAVSISSFSQSGSKKNNLSIGGGRESYNGDLGNSWFEADEEFYGFVSIKYSRYLNKSFNAGASLTYGDYGHCREEGESQFWPDGTERLNMLSRLSSLVVSAEYKFANGYLLKENSRIAPYIYAGVGFNNIANTWSYLRTNPGNYNSLNAGLGAHYTFCEKFNFTYNTGFGYFTSDKLDNRSVGINDMFMQHTLMLGINF